MQVLDSDVSIRSELWFLYLLDVGRSSREENKRPALLLTYPREVSVAVIPADGWRDIFLTPTPTETVGSDRLQLRLRLRIPGCNYLAYTR